MLTVPMMPIKQMLRFISAYLIGYDKILHDLDIPTMVWKGCIGNPRLREAVIFVRIINWSSFLPHFIDEWIRTKESKVAC